MKNFINLQKHNIKSLKDLLVLLYPNLKDDNALNEKIDKKYYLDFIISFLNISKLELLEKIKKVTHIDYAQDLSNIDKDKFLKNIKNLDVLKKYNFCPIMSSGKLKAVITSNPYLLYNKFNIPDNVKMYLALGADINNFLNSFNEIKEEIPINQNSENTFFITMRSLIVECEEKNISKVLFEKIDDSISYSFQDNDEIWKKGQIINQNLDEFWCELKSDFYQKSDFFNLRNIKITNFGNAIIVKWDIPKVLIRNKNNLALVTRDKKLLEKLSKDLKINNIFVQGFEKFIDLYNDYRDYEFKVVIICLNKDLINDEKKIFKQNKSKAKNILLSLGDINNTEAYKLGVDYYIDSNFEYEYLYEIVKNFFK